MTSCSKELRPRPTPKHPLQITTRTLKEPDFKFELLPLHSPLLRQSLLVSFPPLIDMLKFSGYPYLIRGQWWMVCFWRADLPGPRARLCCAHGRRMRAANDFEVSRRAEAGQAPNTKPRLEGLNDARTGMPHGIPRGAMCVQRFDDSLEFCNSHYLSHFAAFFIDARTKRSIVESFDCLLCFRQKLLLQSVQWGPRWRADPPRKQRCSKSRVEKRVWRPVACAGRAAA